MVNRLFVGYLALVVVFGTWLWASGPFADGPRGTWLLGMLLGFGVVGAVGGAGSGNRFAAGLIRLVAAAAATALVLALYFNAPATG